MDLRLPQISHRMSACGLFDANKFMIDMLLFCMVYTSYYLAYVLCRNSWGFSVHLEILVMLLKFNYNLPSVASTRER